MMDVTTYRQLRAASDDESLSYGELIEIQAAFDAIPDSALRDLRENAMADDMLDEIAAWLGFDRPRYQARHDEASGDDHVIDNDTATTVADFVAGTGEAEAMAARLNEEVPA